MTAIDSILMRMSAEQPEQALAETGGDI